MQTPAAMVETALLRWKEDRVPVAPRNARWLGLMAILWGAGAALVLILHCAPPFPHPANAIILAASASGCGTKRAGKLYRLYIFAAGKRHTAPMKRQFP